eukprot:3026219-Prymnesium_polylepis.1
MDARAALIHSFRLRRDGRLSARSCCCASRGGASDPVWCVSPPPQNLGVALANGGNLDAAEEPFHNAVRFDPNVKNWVNLARLHQAKGRAPQAKAAMAEAQALGGM